jgi:hypothetical protein
MKRFSGGFVRLFTRASGAVLFAAASFTALFSFGCYSSNATRPSGGSSNAAPSRALPSGWIAVHNEAIGIYLEIPKGVQIETNEGWTDDGVPLRTHVGRSVLRDRAVFTFYVSEAEGGVIGDPADRLHAISDDFLEEIDRFDIVRTQPLVRDGLPGLRIEFQKPSEELALVVEHFVGRTREYTFVVAMAEAQRGSLASMVEHYFESARFGAQDASIPTGDGSFAADRWSYVTPARDRFSVALPGNASLVEARLELGDDEADVRTYQVATADGHTVFRARVMVGFDDGPPADAFERLSRRLEQAGETIRERWDEPQQGYAGLRARYESAAHHGEVYWVATRTRIYELTIEHPEGRTAELEPMRRRFFRSLRIH